MSYKIETIEGIGPAFAEKLATAGITSTDHLLKLCCNSQGRKTVAEKSGLNEAQLLKWANMADLMRISGVGGEFAELLEAAGVDTVKELRNRNAENLAQALAQSNEVKKLTRIVPNVDAITGWIEQAKTIDPMISH